MLDALRLQRQLLAVEMSRLDAAIRYLPPVPPRAWLGPAQTQYWLRMMLIRSEASKAHAELGRAVAATIQAETTMAGRG
ncbi:hypothetical protein [Homoserinimonas hongtaonis]|nr:hypothetical protein [Salinibacterium hongtaonis]